MVDTQNQTPSLVFPIPGYSGAISPHGPNLPRDNGGSDIMAPVGDTVVSMVSGKVVFTSTAQTAPNSGGNSIQIHGTDNKDYYYAHMLNAPTLKVGDSVVAGQKIGQVDTTGNAKGGPSHLHIGIGYGISEGVRTSSDPSGGGLGQNFDAVAMLRSLVKDPRANNPTLASPDAVPNPPQIQFDPSVPGFDSGHINDIKLNLEKALAAGIDPFLWLGIVSKESTFNAGAVNPNSGACGYAQLYPCTTKDPSANIDQGIAKLKSYLAMCNGDNACALAHYGGYTNPTSADAADYIQQVLSRAAGIKRANPTMATGGFSVPSAISGSGDGSSAATDAPTEDCPPISFGSISLGPLGLGEIKIPNPACIVQFALKNMVTSLSNWWNEWQTSHIPNWTFVILGIIFIIIGGLALANSSGMQAPNVNVSNRSSKSGGGGAAEEAAPIEDVAEVAAV